MQTLYTMYSIYIVHQHANIQHVCLSIQSNPKQYNYKVSEKRGGGGSLSLISVQLVNCLTFKSSCTIHNTY